jgi:hypothetical protein
MVKNHIPNQFQPQPEAQNTVSILQIFAECGARHTPLVVMAGLVPTIPMVTHGGSLSEIAGT